MALSRGGYSADYHPHLVPRGQVACPRPHSGFVMLTNVASFCIGNIGQGVQTPSDPKEDPKEEACQN